MDEAICIQRKTTILVYEYHCIRTKTSLFSFHFMVIWPHRPAYVFSDSVFQDQVCWKRLLYCALPFINTEINFWTPASERNLKEFLSDKGCSRIIFVIIRISYSFHEMSEKMSFIVLTVFPTEGASIYWQHKLEK